MLTCQKCKRFFENVTRLASHLSHLKSSCKCDIKEYYDQYLRKEGEGICIYCGRETAFAGLTKGYPNNKCKHCRNNSEETKEKRRKTNEEKREEKKIITGYYYLPEKCEVCNERFEDRHGLAKHIGKKHEDIGVKNYYDRYLKKPDEGICPITGKETNFKSLVSGYFIYFGKGTCSSDPKIKEIAKQTLLNNFGVDNACKANEEQRIKSYKRTVSKRRSLQEKRKELINLLKRLTIDKSNKLQCQICGVVFDNYKSIAGHIIRGHNIEVKLYYDMFFRKELEGICPSSNKETSFMGLNLGYLKYKENFQNHPDITDKAKLKMRERLKKKAVKDCYKYNVKILNIEELENVCSLIHLRCLKCNRIYENRIYNLQLGYGKCLYCYPKNSHRSEGEKEIFDFLQSQLPESVNILKTYRKLRDADGKLLELDIYIPEKKIAIEFDGLYWHSENILSNPSEYHINKTNICKDNDIRLIHIFEDEWYTKKEIVKKMLLHKLLESNKGKIYARDCYIKEIASNEKNIFLDNNHIQGRDASKIKLGLFIKGTYNLISVMTFSGKNLSRGTINIDDDTWELSRFATDLNYVVIGAAGKLLEYFKRTYRWSKIFSYADLRISDGNLYYKLNFQKVSQTLPSYWYVHHGRRIHRFNLRKRPDEPKDVPEWFLRQQEGFYRIWDCGHLKFEMVNPNF